MILKKGDKVKVNPETTIHRNSFGDNLDYIQTYFYDYATYDTIFEVVSDSGPDEEMVYVTHNKTRNIDSCYKARFIKYEPVNVKLPEGLFEL